MRRGLARIALVAIVALAACTVASADIGYHGWGPRVGVADDPDQVVAGVHWDLGEFVPNLRFEPSAEIGIGDHDTALLGHLIVAWYFTPHPKVRHYPGGLPVRAWHALD